MIYFAAYPPYDKGNPSIGHFHKALENNELKQIIFNFKFLLLWKYRKKVSFLFFHWPASLWRTPNFFVGYLRFFRFCLLCIFSKACGYKLIWSAHNTMPHEYYFKKLEIIGRIFILRNFDLIINHSENASDERYKYFGIKGKNEVVAVHGHYEDYYDKYNPNITRGSLNFKDSDIILLLRSGGKNYNSAFQFYNNFSNFNYERIKLIVIGKALPKAENYTFIEGNVSEADLSSYFRLCDYVILPYDMITTSGAYFLALTFGKGVIARNIDFFIMHSTRKSALLYEDNKLNEMLMDLDKGKIHIKSEDVIEVKNRFAWDHTIKGLVHILNNVMNGNTK